MFFTALFYFFLQRYILNGRQKSYLCNRFGKRVICNVLKPNSYKDNGNIRNSAFNAVNNCYKFCFACNYNNYQEEREIPELAYRRKQGDA